MIVPNTQIGQNQVVDFTYPDPAYRIQTEIRVTYGTDIERVKSVKKIAISNLEGVLSDTPDRPIQVLYQEYGDSTRYICVRWWIDNYKQELPIIDQVNSTLETTLAEAGIEIPFNTYNLKLKQEGEKQSANRARDMQ